MRIALASDHGGYRLKTEILNYLRKEGWDCLDLGTDSEESVDYPDYALKAALAVKNNECQRGIICCGTGVGVAITANKVPGIRAALCHDVFTAHTCREHNDANILTLGQRVIGVGLALEIVRVWLASEFEGGRHSCRLDKIQAVENGIK